MAKVAVCVPYHDRVHAQFAASLAGVMQREDAANEAVTLIGINCGTILRSMPEPDEVVTIGVAGPEVVSTLMVSVAGVATKFMA